MQHNGGKHRCLHSNASIFHRIYTCSRLPCRPPPPCLRRIRPGPRKLRPGLDQALCFTYCVPARRVSPVALARGHFGWWGGLANSESWVVYDSVLMIGSLPIQMENYVRVTDSLHRRTGAAHRSHRCVKRAGAEHRTKPGLDA